MEIIINIWSLHTSTKVYANTSNNTLLINEIKTPSDVKAFCKRITELCKIIQPVKDMEINDETKYYIKLIENDSKQVLSGTGLDENFYKLSDFIDAFFNPQRKLDNEYDKSVIYSLSKRSDYDA